MSGPVTLSAASSARTGWEASVEGEITAIAVRAGGFIAVATEDGNCWRLDPTGSLVARAATRVDVPTRLAVHPTRDALAVSGARGYAVWDGEVHDVAAGWCSAVAFNPRGDLAVATGQRVVIHPEGRAAPYRSSPAPSTVTDVAWTAQGNRVAASAYGGVYVYDGQQTDPVRTHPYLGSHLAVAVNPNGRWVCSGNQDASVHIWRTADNDELQMPGYPSKVNRLAFDSSGQWLANNGAPELTVWDFAGRGPHGRSPRLLNGHLRVVDLDWKPGSNSMLASAGSEGTVRVWSIAGMSEGRSRPAHRMLPFDDALSVRWLPGGEYGGAPGGVAGGDALVVARAGGVVNLIPWLARA